MELLGTDFKITMLTKLKEMKIQKFSTESNGNS